MLDAMRKHAQSWAIKGLFAVIIIVFILLYTSPGEQGAGLQVVATVDGAKITLSEYQKTYDNLINIYRNIYRDGLSEELLKELKLRDKALDNLIDARLLLKEAASVGLKVSDAELIDSISRYPAFQKDNSFNKELYLAVLKANRLTPEEFEESQKRTILMGKAENLIKQGVKVSDEEVRDAYAKQREKINLELIKIDPRDFIKDAKVSNEEALEFYSGNKEMFRIPVRVSAEYVAINIHDVERTINPSSDDLKKYYEKNLDMFMKSDKEAGARPFEEVAGQVASLYKKERGAEAIRQEIYAFRDKAAKAISLEEAASKEKLAITKTGLFSAGEKVAGIGENPDFYKEALTIKPGDLSQPVETATGYVILKVIDRKESRLTEYEEAKEKAFLEASRKKAEKIALKRAEEILAGLKDGKQKMTKLPYKIIETGFFGREEVIPVVGLSGEISKIAFELSRDSPFPVKPVVVSNIAYIMRLKDRAEADKGGLATEEASLRKTLAQKKGDEIMKSWLKIARTNAKITIYEEFLK